MAAAAEAQLDAVVEQAFAAHPLADAGFGEEVDRALLQHAGAHAMLDVLAVARFEHHGLDARAVQEVRQHESGRPRAEDADLRALLHQAGRPSRVAAEEQAVEVRIVQQLGGRPVERQAAHLEHERAVART